MAPRPSIPVLALIVAMAVPAAAQHRDVLIAQDGDSLQVGTFDWGASASEMPVGVHFRRLEEVGDDYAAGNDPGFNALETPPSPFVALPGEAEVRFDFVSVEATPGNLFRWDGTDPVAFEPVRDAESLLWADRSGSMARVDGAARDVEGFVLGTTSGTGVLHEHLDLVLLGKGADAPLSGGEPPRPGIYGVSVVFRMEGLAESPPTFVLLQHGDLAPGRLEAAATWVDARWVDGEDHDFGSGTDGIREATCGADGGPLLGAGLVDHSCFHGLNGPFDAVRASDTPSLAPDVSATHTYYSVESAAGRSCVAYRPLRSGLWAVFTSRPVVMSVRDGDDGLISRGLFQESTGCDELPVAAVYEFGAGSDYSVCFESDGLPDIGVVIEKLSDFETRYGVDGDGDGYGASDQALVTACAPPEGWAIGQDDCDDGARDVFPGAPERCDGVDRDCDGRPGQARQVCGPGAEVSPGDEPNEQDPVAEGGRGRGGCSASDPMEGGAGSWCWMLAVLALLWRLPRRCGPWLVLLALPLASSVSAQHVDILMAEREGRVETGAYDFGKAEGRMPQSAFPRAFEMVGPDGATGNDPGFNAVLEPPSVWSALPPGQAVTIGPAPQAQLLFWDGTMPVRFDLADEGLAFEVAKTGLFGVEAAFEVDHQGSESGPFEFTRTGPSGALHEHLQLTVRDASARQPGPGVYMTAIQLGVDGLQASTPIYLLLHHGLQSADTEQAARCVEDYLVSDCSDGIDNDGDGRIDLDDEGCATGGDLSERPDCEDGIDNDGDGRVDADDTACADAMADSECGDPCDEARSLPFACLGQLSAEPEDGGNDVPDVPDVPDAAVPDAAVPDAAVPGSGGEAGAGDGSPKMEPSTATDPDGGTGVGEESTMDVSAPADGAGCAVGAPGLPSRGFDAGSAWLLLACCCFRWSRRRRRGE